MQRLAIVFLLGIMGCGSSSSPSPHDQPSSVTTTSAGLPPDGGVPPTGAGHVSWFAFGRSAQDVAFGANGALWIISGGRAAQWLPGLSTWLTIFDAPDGGLVRIAVDPAGVPWVVSKAGAIYRRSAGSWQRIAGFALDVGIGANGDVWRVVTGEVVFKYLPDENGWQPFYGIVGKRIAVGPDGSPWVVTPEGRVSHLEAGNWTPRGFADDVGVGANGSVWTVATGGVVAPSGYVVNAVAPPNESRWTADFIEDDWGQATGIAVDATGHPFVATTMAGLEAPLGGDCGWQGAACCGYQTDSHGCVAGLTCSDGVCAN
jgi:virginiamycin B lyase